MGTINELGMYYRNPYFYFLEPPVDFIKLHAFFENSAVLQKLSELRKAISPDELIETLKQHCEQVVRGQNGIGISKDSHGKGYGESYVFPHYFLRKLARSRGVQLEEGYAEKYAEKLGIR